MSMRLEYVFDNTMDIGINFKNGTRYKVYGEVVKRFNLNLINGFNFDFNKGVMGLIGLDARHYQRLDRLSIFAARIAGAASFGSERILYYLGGVDNWLFPSFEEGIPYPQGGNFDFAYQTAATNLRGFGTNIRNGSNFAVVNAELRVPLFRYLNRRTQSSFFRNFHLVGFFDAGTAWQGWNPYAEDNPLNIIDEANGPYVRVKVNYFRDPIVAGYGIGARTLLFGYLLRVDYAWGIETRLVQKPKLYISLGMDF